MRRYHLNNVPFFTLGCAMIMQLAVIGLLISQSFYAGSKWWIVAISICLLVGGFLAFIIHGLWEQRKRLS